MRLNIVSKLEAVNEVIGLDFFTQSLLPTIIELAQDGKWRVRLAIIQHIPLLAGQLGHEFFEQRLRDLCMSWLSDEVFSIREAASDNLTQLTAVFGVAWMRQHILPRVIDMCSNSNYLCRMTALKATVVCHVFQLPTDFSRSLRCRRSWRRRWTARWCPATCWTPLCR